MNSIITPKKAGLLLIFFSLLLLIASFLLCIFTAPEIVKKIFFGNKVGGLLGIIFLWVSALPVMTVFSILIWLGASIRCGHTVSDVYIKKFKIIGYLILFDVVLYFIPYFIFLSPQAFNLSMVFVCLLIQLGGAGLSTVSFAASIVMQKATEYKQEVDTMF